jgi:3-oxoacyl-[acyl-carrier-protein] synthase-3
MPEPAAPTRPRSRPSGAAPRPQIRPAGIHAVASAVPERVVTSSELEERMGLSAGWIESRTGVRERRVADGSETLADLAATAGDRAITAAGVSPHEVDLIVVATVTADQRMPNAAPVVAEMIGAAGAGAIDVGAACTGFVSALAIAATAVEAGRSSSVLVVGADLLSRCTDYDDRRTGGLFGDGAGAVLVGPATGDGAIGPSTFGSDGSTAELIELDHGNDAWIRMNGHDTFRQAVDRLCETTSAALRLDGASLADIDAFIFHQANSRILLAVGERLGIDPERVPDYVGRFGNTSSATIPLALAEAAREERIAPGSRLLLAAFGAGSTWGSLTMTWGDCDVG